MLASEQLEHLMDVWHRAARLYILVGQLHILLLIKVLGVAAAQLKRSDAAGHIAALGARLAQLGQHGEHLLSSTVLFQTTVVLIQVFFFQVCFCELGE